MADWDNVKSSLENNRYKWRTLRGISKETGLGLAELRKLLESHSDVVIKSSIPAESGEELFTTREHFRREQSPFVKITSSVITRVSSSSSGSTE